MNLPNAVLLTLAFTLSTAAFAEGGADRVFTRVVDAQHVTPSKTTEPQVAATDTQKARKCEDCC